MKKDGTVVAAGSNVYGESDVRNWQDIVAINAGAYQTIGLKKDGTVVSTQLPNDFEDNKGQCKVDGWNNIKLPGESLITVPSSSMEDAGTSAVETPATQEMTTIESAIEETTAVATSIFPQF